MTPLTGIVLLITKGKMLIRLETGLKVWFPAKAHIKSGDDVDVMYDFANKKVVDIQHGDEEYDEAKVHAYAISLHQAEIDDTGDTLEEITILPDYDIYHE